MVPGIDPKVDYPFKRLFGSVRNEALLVHVLNAVLRPGPGARVEALEFLNPFTEKEKLDDKLAVVDVKARDQAGRLFNVEMQMIPRLHFPRRLLYYWSKIYSQQLQEGDNYKLLRPTVTICFVNAVLFPAVPAHHLAFRLWEPEQAFSFSDDLAMHIFELPKFARTPEELADPLELWLYFLRHAETLDTDALPGPLNVSPIRQALEELRMLSQDQIERERYEARLKVQRDAISLIRDYESELVQQREKSLKQGLEQGREQGLKLGLVGRIQFSQRLLGGAVTPEEELLSRALGDLTQLADQLEQDILKCGR